MTQIMSGRGRGERGPLDRRGSVGLTGIGHIRAVPFVM